MKKLSKKIAVFCTMTMCAAVLLAAGDMEVCAEGIATAEYVSIEDRAETRAVELEWVYAQIGFDVYKRLYNHSTGEWLTDWIPVD